MRLVVLVEEFYPHTSGGAHTRWRFCQLAAERGHDVTVFTPYEPGLSRKETIDDVEIRRPFRVKPEDKPAYSPISVVTRIAASVLLFVSVCWWLRGQKVDGLHSASHLTHWIGKTLSILYDLPLVSFVGYTPSIASNPKITPKLFLERINFRFFMGQTVFCRTPNVKRTVETHTNVRVEILHGILNRKRVLSAVSKMDSNQRRTDLDIDESDTLLIYVGRLVPIKNPIGAIKILSELPDKYTLAVVGDGENREELKQAVHTYHVEDRVRDCGTLPHEEALEIMASADALVLPSHEESYGAVVFEALTLNTAVFATPVGAVPAVDHPHLYVGSVDEIPGIITQTAIDSDEGIDTNTLEQFSMERYTNRLINTFEDLCHRGTNDPGCNTNEQ